ncbi:39S ribosomal protein L11, mitochondrial-like [Mya arenaria]|uniref:39S ribosomal protein L11, mitochondrial-like n=1 Tax=Mya arenaria TaxID=6604 RepID=UPI0022E8DB8E|nr:39S ribosomal protein L11, mitochondrial-like [Mya arenaria]
MSAKKALGAKTGKAAKQFVKKSAPSTYLQTFIRAGQAAAAPPLGPSLGSRNIQIGPFCKQFNEQTKDIQPGIPLPTFVNLNPDRSVTIKHNKPPVTYFLKKAAGARKGALYANEVAGKVTLKHIYEIAKIKIQDHGNRAMTLEDMCKAIIATAHSVGIQVVSHLDSKEYQEFLRERELRIEEHEAKLEEIRQSKLLRL